MYPEASSDVTVQMIIDWACAGLTFFNEKQDSENDSERRIAKISIPLLIGLISVCQGKDPIAGVKECMVKNN